MKPSAVLFVALGVGGALAPFRIADADSVPEPAGVARDAASATAHGTVRHPPAREADPFDRGHILEVTIEIAPADWDVLRHQARDFFSMLTGDCLEQPFPDPFVYFPAVVTIDGRRFADVGVRKKGLLGSMSETKPSLKVKLDEFVDGQEWLGLDRLTLNNSVQDPSYLNQCMAYDLFARAGVPAPRCSFAHLVVNGHSLGLYVNVESIRKDFLRRHFADDEGNLYEGTLSDFRRGWTGTFEKKTNEDETDRADLQRVVAALEAGDGELLARVDAVLDLDAYLTFWAMEVLVSHWDGYAGNNNNFFVYADPSDGRFRFLPWGADGLAFERDPAVTGRPASVSAESWLPRRLYLHPDTRQRYADRLRALTDTHWIEDSLHADVDRLAAGIRAVVPVDERGGFDASVAAWHRFVDDNGRRLRAELADGPPPWPYPPRAAPCLHELGTTAGSARSYRGDQDPFRFGTGELDVALGRVPLPVIDVGPALSVANGRATLYLLGTEASGDYLVFVADLPAEAVATGRVVTLDLAGNIAYLYRLHPDGSGVLLGLLGRGALTFDRAGSASGDELEFHLTGTLFDWSGWVPDALQREWGRRIAAVVFPR